MGSLSSRPTVPTTQVVYAPQSTNTNTQTTSGDQSSESDGDATTTAEAREDDLLRRQRGRSSTVLTGFRGLLDNGNTAAQKKTLLGE